VCVAGDGDGAAAAAWLAAPEPSVELRARLLAASRNR
jgi:hypothetical protein